MEEGQSALASYGRGVRFEVRALIAVEAVAGVFVEEDGKAGMGLLDFLNLGGGNVFVLCTEMQHDRTARLFRREFCDLTTVVRYGGRGVETRRR